MVDEKDNGSGTWVIVSAGAEKHIGRVVGIDGVSIEKKTVQGGENAVYNEVPAEKVANAKSLTLSPAYDYMTPVGPMQGPNGETTIGRRPLVLQLDMLSYPCPAHIHNITRVILFSQMAKEDRQMFHEMLGDVRKQELVNRAKRAGIHLPGEKPGA